MIKQSESISKSYGEKYGNFTYSSISHLNKMLTDYLRHQYKRFYEKKNMTSLRKDSLSERMNTSVTVIGHLVNHNEVVIN